MMETQGPWERCDRLLEMNAALLDALKDATRQLDHVREIYPEILPMSLVTTHLHLAIEQNTF